MSNQSILVSINATSGDMTISGDPNWDDQQTRIDGKIINDLYTLPKGETVAASVSGFSEHDTSDLMMGLWYSGVDNNNQNQNSFQFSVGINHEGKMAITESFPLPPLKMKYTVIAQTKWVVVVKFEDA